MLSLSSELYLLWSFLPSLRLVSFCPPLSSRHGFVDTYKHIASCSTPLDLCISQFIHSITIAIAHRPVAPPLSSPSSSAVAVASLLCHLVLLYFFGCPSIVVEIRCTANLTLLLKPSAVSILWRLKPLRVLVIIFTMISCLGGKQWLCPHLAICVV